MADAEWVLHVDLDQFLAAVECVGTPSCVASRWW